MKDKNSKILSSQFSRLPLQKRHGMTSTKSFHLHNLLVSAGHEIIDGSEVYFYDGLKRGNAPFTNFQFTIAGQGKLNYHGKLYEIKAGDLFITNVPDEHQYYYDPKNTEPWEFVYLTFAGSEARRIVNEILRLSGPVLTISTGIQTTLASLMQKILVRKVTNAFYYSAQVYQLLLSVLFQEIEKRKSRKNSAPVLAMREYIEKKFATIKSIGEITAQSGLAENYAMKVFKTETGQTIQDELEEKRIEHACQLLQYNSSLSIKEIAYQVGFHDSNYFIRVFKHQKGLTPKKFRDR